MPREAIVIIALDDSGNLSAMDMHGQMHQADSIEDFGSLCLAIVQDPSLPPIARPSATQLAAGDAAVRVTDRMLGRAATALGPLITPIVDLLAQRAVAPKPPTPEQKRDAANTQHAIRATTPLDRRKILATRRGGKR